MRYDKALETWFRRFVRSWAPTVWLAAVGVMGGVAGCGDVNSVLKQQSDARHLAADLLVQFTTASDASNRAVIANSDEASVAAAREADQAKDAVQKDVDLLGPMLHSLEAPEETRLLQQFTSRFAEYRTLDQRILDLAVENTNIKAQRLSYGPAQDAADTFRDALETLPAAAAAGESWHVKALVATAVLTVREIQVLQAPHIAAADDAVMTSMEKRMATSEAGARKALATLATLVPPASRPNLNGATTALDTFMDLNAQIIALSRRNTNVRSFALSLNEKRPLITACADSLRELRDALAKRRYPSGR